jgi:hypothetical protein
MAAPRPNHLEPGRSEARAQAQDTAALHAKIDRVDGSAHPDSLRHASNTPDALSALPG